MKKGEKPNSPEFFSNEPIYEFKTTVEDIGLLLNKIGLSTTESTRIQIKTLVSMEVALKIVTDAIKHHSKKTTAAGLELAILNEIQTTPYQTLIDKMASCVHSLGNSQEEQALIVAIVSNSLCPEFTRLKLAEQKYTSLCVLKAIAQFSASEETLNRVLKTSSDGIHFHEKEMREEIASIITEKRKGVFFNR